MRIVFLLILMVSFASGGSAQVFHEVDGSKEEVILNSTIRLNSDEPTNRWRLSWSVPEGSEVIDVRDSLGEAEYELDGRTLSIQTNSGERRKDETLRVVTRTTEPPELIHEGLWRRTLSLPSLDREDTEVSAKIHVEDLIAGRASYGFETGFSNRSMSIQGKGPVSASFKAGRGNRTRYFEFFGKGDEPNNAAMEVPVGATGVVPGFRRFAVAVLPGEKYNRTVNEWSQGEYFGGKIRLRKGLGEEFEPVLAHEVVHGLNDKVLAWDQTKSSYFDEGVASYIENLMKENLSRSDKVAPPGELFGESTRYDPNPGDGRYFVVSPRGSRDRLWSYYQKNQSFMETWNARQEGAREFGYAYSELIVRNFISGGGELRELYSELDPGNELESAAAKRDFLSRYVELRPCDFESRQRFDSCLDDINDYDYMVPRATNISPGSSIQVRKIRIPEREPTETSQGRTPVKSITRSSTGIVQLLGELFENLLLWL